MNLAETVTLVLALALNILGLFMPVRWLSGAFIASVIATSYIQLAISVGPLNLRLCQMVLPVVVFQLVRCGALRTISATGLKLVLAGLLFWAALIFWTGVHFLDSDRNTGEALGHVALIGLNMFHSVAAYALIVHSRQLRSAIVVLVLSVVVCNLVLLIAGTDYVQQRVDLGAFFSIGSEDAPVLVDGATIAGHSARFVVGVNAGNLSAAALVLLVCMWFTGEKPWRWIFAPAACITTIGMIVGFSRQALVGLAASFLLLALYLIWLRHLRPVVGATVIFGGLLTSFWGLGQWSATEPYWQAFMGRALQLLDSGSYSSGTARSRLQIWSGMLEDIQANPIAGNGQDAYLAHVSGFIKSHNYPLEVLHAAGLFGLLPYLYLHLLALWAALRLILSTRVSEADRWTLVGLTLAFFVLLLSSFTNLITWNQTYWLLLGMVVAACRLNAPPPRGNYFASPLAEHEPVLV